MWRWGNPNKQSFPLSYLGIEVLAVYCAHSCAYMHCYLAYAKSSWSIALICDHVVATLGVTQCFCELAGCPVATVCNVHDLFPHLNVTEKTHHPRVHNSPSELPSASSYPPVPLGSCTWLKKSGWEKDSRWKNVNSAFAICW